MAQDCTSTKLVEVPRPHRKRERYSDDTADAWSFLRSEWLGHLALPSPGENAAPYALPMMYAADEPTTLWLHGSTGSAASLLARSGGEVAASFTVTRIDGIVLARSAMHHSINYASAVAHGRLTLVTDEATKRRAFNLLLDAVIEGRSAQCRPADAKELAETAVLGLRVDGLTLKQRTGGAIDDVDDLALPHWAGVVPVTRTLGVPEPAPDLPAGARPPATTRNKAAQATLGRAARPTVLR